MDGVHCLLISTIIGCFLGCGETKVLPPGVLSMHQDPPHQILPEAGDFINCGNASTEALITFRPRHFSFGDNLDVRCHIIPPVDVDGGTVDVSVYVPGLPDPVYDKGGIAFSCEQVHVYFPFMCPFKTGVPIDAQKTYYLAPDTPLPVGDLYIKLKLYQVPKPDKEFLCLFGHVSVIDG